MLFICVAVQKSVAYHRWHGGTLLSCLLQMLLTKSGHSGHRSYVPVCARARARARAGDRTGNPTGSYCTLL